MKMIFLLKKHICSTEEIYVSSKVSRNSEANASEFLDTFEEGFTGSMSNTNVAMNGVTWTSSRKWVLQTVQAVSIFHFIWTELHRMINSWYSKHHYNSLEVHEYFSACDMRHCFSLAYSLIRHFEIIIVVVIIYSII